MKKSLFLFFGLLALLILGCSSDDDDNGTNGDEPPPPPARVIVDTMVVAPTMSAVDEATWFNVDSTLITIGANSSKYGKNSVISQQDIPVKAIMKSDTLYIKVSWKDNAGADSMANNWRRLSMANFWDYQTLIGQDMFFLLFDAQDNRTEMADCATMCHSDGMKTTGGGHADAWKWMATVSTRANLSEDLWVSGTSTAGDATINDYFYRDNELNSLPWKMNKDTVQPTPVLYWGDAVNFANDAILIQYGYSWTEGFIIPGYLIDSSILHSTTRNNNSLNNVRSISSFNSGTNTWTVVFSRAMNTGKADDVDLSILDSIQVTLAATDDHPEDVIYPATKPPHSGSAPFWLILKPE